VDVHVLTLPPGISPIEVNSIQLIYYRANLTARRQLQREHVKKREIKTHIQNTTQGHFDDK
jgi:hypothetical protein